MWMVTFADLSTLLLCFFVLLLSFSEMDVSKFKELAGSMREAFGVQAEIKAKQIPKGTSIIAREFSPAEPTPTALNQVRQFTVDSAKNTLNFADPDNTKALQEAFDRQNRAKTEAEKQAEDYANKIAEGLKKEIDEGKVIVRSVGPTTIIHILERGLFQVGGADIQKDLRPILIKIHDLLLDTSGTIRIAGHTDSVPISNSRFSSNWALSSARAVSVAHVLMASGDMPADRFVVSGYADTKPIGDNSTAEGRALNRRVDVSIYQGDDYMTPSEESDSGLSGDVASTGNDDLN